jgi:hypothetical protein
VCRRRIGGGRCIFLPARTADLASNELMGASGGHSLPTLLIRLTQPNFVPSWVASVGLAPTWTMDCLFRNLARVEHEAQRKTEHLDNLVCRL